jgi:uncharacterized protein (TIGR02246 family)
LHYPNDGEVLTVCCSSSRCDHALEHFRLQDEGFRCPLSFTTSNRRQTIAPQRTQRCAIRDILHRRKEERLFAVFYEPPYGTHVPVEEPSTASQADISPSRHFHALTWVGLTVVLIIKTIVEMAMKLRWFLVLLVVSASTLSAYAQDAKKTADEFATKWVTAYDAGDAGALAALFTQDGVFNAPSGAVLKGRDAIAKALAGRIKAGWTKETVMTSDAGMAGNAIWAAGEYGLLGSGEVAGKQTGGHFGWVLVRDGDIWHIAMLTANATPPK